jgi:hypothetical protein
MIRINRCLKKEFGVRKSTRTVYAGLLLLLMLIAIMTSGCGSDPGPGEGATISRSPGNTVSITSSNAEDIVSTVFSSASQYFDVMERLFTALPDDSCPFGGSATIEIEDGGISGQAEAGESVRRQYTDCKFSDPVFKGSFNGGVMIDVTRASDDVVLDQRGNIFLGMNEDSSAAFEVAVDDFKNTELEETTGEDVSTILGVEGSASRELGFVQRDLERTDQSKGKSFSISQGDEGSEFSNFDMLCQRRGIDNQINFSIDASLTSFVLPSESSSDNLLDSSKQGGSNVIGGFSMDSTSETVKIKTTTAFTALFNFSPDSGQMTIEGAQGTRLVISALGSDSIRLQIDADGNGNFTDNNDRDGVTTWTDIGVEFQGFCLN